MRKDSDAFTLVDVERRRDRMLRRASVIAWGVTFVMLVAFALIIGQRVALMAKMSAVGALGEMAKVQALMPLVVVLGVLSLLIAVLTTIGIFLRLRTASLTEIQLRLSALEAMLAREADRSS